ncbi:MULTISPECIES: SGNH/GDSL hydrolase family protein [unclassified Okeania]|nr:MULTISPECIES: SGNH/GDSL hydrolase family protein [unclassified Okeania]NEP72703.1 SGNH/GDSL hydrolase family protein [Okeania sp. SIO2G5]NET77133.1 SGNH/GDSL hydrolase family protein [Okeania sp. SIO1F9]
MFKRLSFNVLTITIVSMIMLMGIVVKTPDAYAAKFGSVSHIYAFGDSYSDNGASFEISTQAVDAGVPGSFILPADPALGIYDSEGRATNGLTTVEVLSQNLQVGLTDYAVVGAKSGNGNYNAWLDDFQDTGAFGQIEQFTAELSGQVADRNALYFIFISANDLLEYVDFDLPGTVEELSVQTVNNIGQSLSNLAALGANKFMVVNSSDIGIVPHIIEFDNTDEAVLFTKLVNELLPQKLEMLTEELGAEIVLYDHIAISDQIRSKPDQYTLTNLNYPCQPTSPIEPACSLPDEYYFWDEIHPTARVHQIIGEDMAIFVKNQQ